MPKFNKPDSPNIIWGVNALDTDLTKPDDSYIETGWTQVKPPYEYENYSMNKLYQGLAYYNQLGIPEWDSVTEYQNGKSYVQGSNNRVYKCIQTHTNRTPTTSGNEAYWELFEGNRQATTTSRGTVETSTDQETIDGSSTTVAVTPASLNARASTTDRRGLIEIATDAEEGSWSSKILSSTPGGIAAAFSSNSSKNTNGFQRLPGGLIIQWGQTPAFTSNNEARAISFPINFPTNCLWFDINAAGAISGALDSSEGMEVASFSASSASVISHWHVGTLGIVRWFAIGH